LLCIQCSFFKWSCYGQSKRRAGLQMKFGRDKIEQAEGQRLTTEEQPRCRSFAKRWKMSIYLDNAATTKPLISLGALFAAHIEADWHNPSAMYPPAVRMERELARAREALARPVHADPACVVCNSGGTEGANTVILRGFRPAGERKLHFITSAYEHPCVYESFRTLEAQGHRVDYILPRADGKIHPQDVAERVAADTALVSVIHVQNETGALNDVAAIAAAVKAKNPDTLVHADGVQGYVKCSLDFPASSLDYYTASAHKLHGLKGVGVLFYKKGAPIKPYLLGGGQEGGLRSGTENTFGILAFAAAAEAYMARREANMEQMGRLKALLLEQLGDVPDMRILSPEDGVPYIVNLAFPGMRGEVLLHLLEQKGIYISTGSACSSKKGRLSRVHQSLDIPKEVSEGAVRLSFCPGNTGWEIETAAAEIKEALLRFRGLIRR